MSVTRPTSLSEADLASTTDILVEAFWPDVAMQAMAAFDKGVLGYMMRKRLEAALAIHAAVIYRASSAQTTVSSAAGEGEGEIIGVLTINPPGLDHSAVRKSYATDQPFMDHISQDTKDWLNNSYYPWFAKWSGETFGPSGLGDSLYINLVAVRADQRRKGVGKKLMRAALEQAEGEGVEVTLLSHEEENRNRKGELIKKTAYYTSLGFKTVGYATLTIKDTETRWWGMQRPPDAKSAE